MKIPNITIQQLLEAGVHLGHKTLRWNPKMKKYIFGKRDSIHIIDLTQTLELTNEALEKVYNTIINNENQTLRRLFEDWMEFINNKDDNSGETEWRRYQQDVIVEHLDRNDNTLTHGKYILREAFPINMSEIALQYAQNDIIEEFTVTFQYQTYEVS